MNGVFIFLQWPKTVIPGEVWYQVLLGKLCARKIGQGM